MEEGAPGTWADETPGSPENSCVAVLEALSHLINHGVQFKPVEHWSKTAQPMLVEKLSLFLGRHSCYQPGDSGSF